MGRVLAKDARSRLARAELDSAKRSGALLPAPFGIERVRLHVFDLLEEQLLFLPQLIEDLERRPYRIVNGAALWTFENARKLLEIFQSQWILTHIKCSDLRLGKVNVFGRISHETIPLCG